MAEPRPSDPTALLLVRGLNVYYGRSHALQGVDLKLEHGVLSVVGRNGMGKTTLCKAIMGLVPASSGSVRMRGAELVGRPPAEIARHGIGYVPQGRRLWRSLTVDEHLRMIAAGRKDGAWTVERVYDAFPRLAERKSNGGGQLSGGEQQMLAIARALVTNPHLLIMDEPTEGLAPVIVAQVEEMLVRLGSESDIAILVIEQNIGVATSVSDHVAIMVNGRINRIVESRRLAADRDLQQRLLGVGRHSEAAAEPERGAPDASAPGPARPSRAAVRIYVSNPVLPTRWSHPVPNARIEASARIATAGSARSEETRERRSPALVAPPGPPTVIVAGTLDTKGPELRFIRDLIAGGGLRARLVDVSTSGKLMTCDVTAQEVALNYGRGGQGVFGSDRGASVAAMAEAFEAWMRRQGDVAGVIGAGGSGGASIVAPAMRALPIGTPKVLVSSVASGDVGRYVGPSDITMMHSVTDVQGLNRISRQVLANGAQALIGMVKARLAERDAAAKARPSAEPPAAGLTMFGVTTPCVQQIAKALEPDWECLVFHATGVGGRAMEKLVELGTAAGRDRRHDHRSGRHADGWRARRGRRPVRRRHPHPDALRRLGRRPRHGQFRRAGDGPAPVQGAAAAGAQSPGDADAHERGRERTDRALDRRPAQSHGRAGAVLPPRARCLGARRAGAAVPRPASGRGAVSRPRADRAADGEPPGRPRPPAHQRP